MSSRDDSSSSSSEKSQKTGLTPYQGPGRSFGSFNCFRCGRHWMSSNSWQRCGKCFAKVYPHKQFDPDDPQGVSEYDANVSCQWKAHRKELCKRCTKLGHHCSKKRRA